MDKNFKFEDASSEEEIELEEENEGKETQSPWDFSLYSESIAEEHARKNTTSVDDKISRALEQRPLSFSENNEETNSDIESDKQENFNYVGGVTVDTKERSVTFFSPSEGVSFHATSFFQLNLSRPLLRACEFLGYHKPTPIQAACIPIALTGRDICGSAITGSGKTAAFTLPVLERLLFRPKSVHAIRVLILSPARELAVQVHDMIEKLAQFTDIRSCIVVGGLPTKMQEAALRSMPDIVVATPGRMVDHLRNSQSVGLEDLAVLILDEADRLLELGFSAEIQELLRLCPKRRQTMLFSATMTEKVDELIKLSLTRPMRLSADPTSSRPAKLTEEVVRIRRMRVSNQEAVLLAMCTRTFKKKVIIFSGTKQAAHRLKILFGLAGLKAAELHGNLTQVQRLDALELFKKQQVDFLIATDVAARGLDILGVQTVINFVCPRDYTSYLHRVGRTARAGKEGCAVTFVTDNDRAVLKSIAKMAGSLLKNRIVSEQSINKWSQIIEQMEDRVAAVLEEERAERALRKAEMEATKAENMIQHKDEIYSRPKRTWFTTEKEKKLLAKEAKVSTQKEDTSKNQVISVKQADDIKKKEKRKQEREKNLPRKKRRRLEAAREMLEDGRNVDITEGGKSVEKEKSGKTLVELGYLRAKSMKSMIKAQAAGKFIKMTEKTPKKSFQRNKNRAEEMQELFQSEMSESKQVKNAKGRTIGPRNKKSKNAFKSISR